MRSAMFLMSVIGVIALAFWAYRENHNTRQAMAERSALTREVASLHEAILVQRAEWAFLNRPDRLRELVVLNFDRLQLLPMGAQQFGAVTQIVYPEPVRPPAPELPEEIEPFGADPDAAESHRTDERVP